MANRKKRAQRKLDAGDSYQVGPGTLVTLSYELYDAEGDLVEAALPPDGLVFLHGFGQVIAALEQGVAGMCVGQARRLNLGPAQAFGVRDPEKIIEVDRAELPAEVEIGDEMTADLEEGGGAVALTVLELCDDLAVLDANHPLAGQKVELDVVVEDVRPATELEMEQAAALLESNQGRGPGTLIPADRLLKRSPRQFGDTPDDSARSNQRPPIRVA
jgi:FKBP-type peptidyl-prolyl cis-trans isomerase SlyD